MWSNSHTERHLLYVLCIIYHALYTSRVHIINMLTASRRIVPASNGGNLNSNNIQHNNNNHYSNISINNINTDNDSTTTTNNNNHNHTNANNNIYATRGYAGNRHPMYYTNFYSTHTHSIGSLFYASSLGT